MRILVHEHVSSGAFAANVASGFSRKALLREGRAMRSALVADLEAAGHDVVTSNPDAVWLIAPETGRTHQQVARRLESQGTTLLGSSAAAIRRASDKRALALLLERHHIPHPRTHILRDQRGAASISTALGYPVVVKPARGAGCMGVSIASNPRELGKAVADAREAAGQGLLLVQEYVAGVPASVSLLADGERAVPLTLNSQQLRRNMHRLAYDGGGTPLRHPRAACALDVAARTCALVPGLRGFVGVDLVLTDTEAVVIEVNPRLTTAYLGVRKAIGANVAAMALAACRGELPSRVTVRRSVSWGQTP
jgi:predicted ATP-grasp superfamily ATP-dependent carboligase